MLREQNSIPGMNRLENILPKLLIFVFALQPLMDILSYWVNKLGMGNSVTLVLRLGVLAAVVLVGFFVSKRKKVYFITAAVLAALFAGHTAACMSVGYQNIITDVTNYIRVVQMPLFAMCFITFVKANDKCFEAMENGMFLNFWIITVSVALSVITGTQNSTYQASGFGVLGWFATSNAQSAVLSLMTPILVCLCIYRKKNIFVFALTAIAAFAQLYLLGTRLAFLSMFVTVFGVIIIMLITKSVSKKHIAILIACLAVCCVFIKQSPMYKNQQVYLAAMSQKQGDAYTMMEQELTDPNDEEQHIKALKRVYNHYSKRLCSRFGVETVMEKYDYTYDISKLTAVRPQKIMYCKLLMDEHPFVSRIFGMELDRMTFNNFVFDVENDFHGIYFLYGAAGLLLMIGFLLYFIVLIVKALLKDFKKYFNMRSGAYGMALCLAMAYAYCTAGVLRRPNSSFYLSVILAIVYCIVKLKIEDDSADSKELSE